MKQSALSRMVAAFKERVREEYAARLRLSFSFCQQWYHDNACIAAAEAFGLDPDGVKKFSDALAANTDEFTELWNADASDCEYTMTKQDERLKELCGKYWIPYEQRYVTKVSELRKRWDTDAG